MVGWRAIVSIRLRLQLILLNGNRNGIGRAGIILYLRWDSDVWMVGAHSIYKRKELISNSAGMIPPNQAKKRLRTPYIDARLILKSTLSVA